MNRDEESLREQLRRDAEAIRNSAEFDPKLHADTMRTIRLAPGRGSERKRGRARAFAAVTGATAICIALVVLLRPGEPLEPSHEVAVVEPPRSRPLNLAYRRAFAEGDDALLAMLDRDARSLLPRSASVFNAEN